MTLFHNNTVRFLTLRGFTGLFTDTSEHTRFLLFSFFSVIPF